MNGAREYANLFKSGQYGKLYIISGHHARGKTFHIYVLPTDDSVASPHASKSVEVYGITGGQPGWTETYGWLHHGRWQEDFYALVESRKKEIADLESEALRKREQSKAAEKLKIEDVLSKY